MNKTESKAPGYHILLTGGSGFLGTSILRELLDPSSPLLLNEVRVFDIAPLEGFVDERITFVMGDVRDEGSLVKACEGMDLVIHSAAIVDWGTKTEKEVMGINFQGTLNVIEACRAAKVGALVYTSSLDVLFDGKPLPDVDESTPYPAKHSNSYCRSKYMAEEKVLQSNGDTLRTCSIRPSDIFGEGDPYHIGSLIEMARGGFYVRLGNGEARCQHVYVGNVAQAHVLASLALLDGNPRVSGQAYFITDGPASNFFSFFDAFIEGIGYRIRPKNLWLPRWFAYGLGSISELVALLVRPFKKYTPKMSRFAVVYTCTDYTFNSDKASRDFGFDPRYGRDEAFRRTIEYFRPQGPGA